MIKTNLLEKYPNLLEICKANDCCFSEGIKIIEESNKLNSLRRFL